MKYCRAKSFDRSFVPERQLEIASQEPEFAIKSVFYYPILRHYEKNLRWMFRPSVTNCFLSRPLL